MRKILIKLSGDGIDEVIADGNVEVYLVDSYNLGEGNMGVSECKNPLDIKRLSPPDFQLFFESAMLSAKQDYDSDGLTEEEAQRLHKLNRHLFPGHYFDLAKTETDVAF